MDKRWTLLSADAIKVDALQNALKINRTLCKILVQRGIDTYENAKQFFRPSLDQLHSPWLMKDMEKAIHRITQAIHSREKILVYGDYDVDGTTAVASMYLFLNQLHNQLDFYIPHRYKEGYGISKAGIDYAHENGFTLIIALDCGIKSVELISYAKQLGIDFIVCDHHLPDNELPPAVAILNPKQKDCNYPFKDLCGCGVGFKLMMALAEKFNLPNTSYLPFLDLVATAIAADIVSLVGENRILAFYGLKKVNENPNKGIKALKELSGITNTVSLTNLVFMIAPRINAAGRMDDARKAVLLFIENDEQKAKALASELHSDNQDRKEADANITAEALKLIESAPDYMHKKTTVVYQPHWHKGVVGIVASRLTEKYYRPTVVLTKSGDVLAGSARSVVGFNLYEAIHACRAYLIGYGGHFAAAGMTLMEHQLEAFSNKFEEVVSSTIEEQLLIPEIIIDAELTFQEISSSFYNILQQMEPYGPENMRPVFISKAVSDTGYSKIVKDIHLKVSLNQNGVALQGIGFNLAHLYEVLTNHSYVDIIYTLDENTFNGNTSIQLKVIDIRKSE